MILHDTCSNDSLTTGLSLTELMHLIRVLDPSQTFIFFDACSIRLNQIENPLNDLDVISLSGSKGLFCLFSSGIYPSYEDVMFKYGYFTSALLKAISELRLDSNASCYDILKKVQCSLNEKALPLPESYYIGSNKMWPLEQYYEKEDVPPEKEANITILRNEAIAKLQDYLVGMPDPIVWMWGEGGLGKSIIAQQLSHKNRSMVYISIPSNPATFATTYQSLIAQIRVERGALFFDRPPETSLHQILKYLIFHKPDSTLIIDHLDRLTPEDLANILIEIDRTQISCILISRYPYPKNLFVLRASKIMEWRAAPFSAKETEQIMIKSGINLSYSSLLLNATDGNALKVRQMIVKLSGQDGIAKQEVKAEYIKTVSTIVSCGGFLDELLFTKIFKIKSSTINSLERLGLIHYTKEGCYPHDTLIEMVHENLWPISHLEACKYWNSQVLHTPYNHWACRSLIFFATQIEDCNFCKRALDLCLSTLNQRESLNFNIDLVNIFKKYNWESLLLKSSTLR